MAKTKDKAVSSLIAESLFSVELDYTALNMLLSNGRKWYAARCFQKYEDYYTLYYYALPNGIIICSEPIESKDLSQDRWVLMANKSLLKIKCDPFRYEIIQFDPSAC